MMDFIVWLIIGALAGWIASMIAGTNAQQGWLMNIVVGIIGAMVGGFLLSLLPGFGFAADGNNGFIGRLIVAVIGAVILLFIYRALTGRTARV